MKKEAIICDNCKRQLNEGEQYVTRCISSSTYDTRTEDVCMGCVYLNISTSATYAIDPKFSRVIQEGFWNIL